MGQVLGKLEKSSITNLHKIIGKREIGLFLIAAYHNGIKRLLIKYNVNTPPVLVSLLSILGALGVTRYCHGKQVADEVIMYFDPSVEWFGDWMPLWLSAPLVALPNALLAVKQADSKTWVKLGVVHFLSWLGTVYGTSALYRSIEHMTSDRGKSNHSSKEYFQGKSTTNNNVNTSPQSYEKKRKQLRLIRFWGVVAAGFYIASAAKYCPVTPALAATSTVSILAANEFIPPSIKKVVHPIVVTAFASAVATILLQHLRGSGNTSEAVSWRDALKTYFSNQKGALTAGDLLLDWMGPSCAALAFRVFRTVQSPTMRDALPVVLSSSTIAALVSLLLTPAIGRAVGLPDVLNLAMANRTITTSLALPSAQAIGASAELTAAAVLITGLYGTFGQSLLEMSGVTDHTSVGTTIGVASHAIGTGAMVGVSPTAGAAASTAMFAAGIATSLACSIPQLQSLLRQLASGSSSLL